MRQEICKHFVIYIGNTTNTKMLHLELINVITKVKLKPRNFANFKIKSEN